MPFAPKWKQHGNGLHQRAVRKDLVSPTPRAERDSKCVISLLGNCSEDISCILERAPFKKSWAYLQGQ